MSEDTPKTAVLNPEKAHHMAIVMDPLMEMSVQAHRYIREGRPQKALGTNWQKVAEEVGSLAGEKYNASITENTGHTTSETRDAEDKAPLSMAG